MTLTAPQLLTLAEAALRLSPSGAISARSLRTEIEKGRLRSTMIARKHLVTEHDLAEMVIKCREENSRPASGCAGSADATPSGLSSTDRYNAARARLNQSAKRLKKPSPNTSEKSTNTSATVIPMTP